MPLPPLDNLIRVAEAVARGVAALGSVITVP